MNTSQLNNRPQPHIQNGRFCNTLHEKRHPIIFHSALMYLKKLWRKNEGLADLHRWHQCIQNSSIASPSITWIGHSTFLIKLDEYTILTDPVFDNLTILYQRLQKPGILLDELPQIDVVLISHNHRDHMERTTLQYLAHKNPKCLFFVPQGDASWLRKWGITSVREFLWWQQADVQKNTSNIPVTCTFLPAHHWSQRSFLDYNRSLWGSWMIEHPTMRIYFGGDSAYDTHFKAIASQFDTIHYALMPIGPCEPQIWMKFSHMNAEEAGQATLDLNAHFLIPMHWGTYAFGTEAPLEPLQRILAWRKNIQHTRCTINPMAIGDSKPLITNLDATNIKTLPLVQSTPSL